MDSPPPQQRSLLENAPEYAPARRSQIVVQGDSQATRSRSSSCRLVTSLQEDEASSISQSENSAQDQDDSELNMDLRTRMQIEKERYPGAFSWAEAEERLFEVLFLREEVPILPSHWNVDFLGVPMSESVFASSTDELSSVYAKSEVDFAVTQSLEQLINLTADVRTATQSAKIHKAPRMIKDRLDRFLMSLAHDGGYSKLRIVPNIVAEIVSGLKGDYITEYIYARMRALATIQREFLREDRDPKFWTLAKKLLDPNFTKISFLGRLSATSKKRKLSTAFSELDIDTEYRLIGNSGEAADNVNETHSHKRACSTTSADKMTQISNQEGIWATLKQKLVKLSPNLDYGKGTITAEKMPGPTSPGQNDLRTTEPGVQYVRTPPVVYGLFVVSATLLVLTVDSTKADGAYITFHCDLDLLDSHQSVWNALTVAIAACQARDELCTRLEDFEELPEEQESDPDV